MQHQPSAAADALVAALFPDVISIPRRPSRRQAAAGAAAATPPADVDATPPRAPLLRSVSYKPPGRRVVVRPRQATAAAAAAASPSRPAAAAQPHPLRQQPDCDGDGDVNDGGGVTGPGGLRLRSYRSFPAVALAAAAEAYLNALGCTDWSPRWTAAAHRRQDPLPSPSPPAPPRPSPPEQSHSVSGTAAAVGTPLAPGAAGPSGSHRPSLSRVAVHGSGSTASDDGASSPPQGPATPTAADAAAAAEAAAEAAAFVPITAKAGAGGTAAAAVDDCGGDGEVHSAVTAPSFSPAGRQCVASSSGGGAASTGGNSSCGGASASGSASRSGSGTSDGGTSSDGGGVDVGRSVSWCSAVTAAPSALSHCASIAPSLTHTDSSFSSASSGKNLWVGGDAAATPTATPTAVAAAAAAATDDDDDDMHHLQRKARTISSHHISSTIAMDDGSVSDSNSITSVSGVGGAATAADSGSQRLSAPPKLAVMHPLEPPIPRPPPGTRHYTDGRGPSYVQPLPYRLLAQVTLAAYVGWPYALLALTIAALCGYTTAVAILVVLAGTLLLPVPDTQWDVWMQSSLFWLWRGYFNFSMMYEEMIDLSKPHIYAMSPHGAFPLSQILGGSIGHILWPGHNIRCLAASVLFYVPIWRHIKMWMGAAPADRATAIRMLTTHGSIGVLPGGIAEMFVQAEAGGDRCERVKLLGRRGFVRLAVETGVPIVPCYHFGNSQILSFGPAALQPLSRRLRMALGTIMGLWGLPVPRPQPLFMCIGRPIHVPYTDPRDPDFERVVDETLEKVMASYKRLYEQYGKEYGWGDRPLEVW